MRSSSIPVVACGVLALAGACTKTLEQPPPPPVAEAPAPPPPAAPRPRPSAPTGWAAPAPAAAPAEPTAAAPPAAPVADTLNGDPKGPTREALSQALDGVLPAVARCFPDGAASVGVSLEADPSGKAANVKVTGAGAAEGCVRGAVAAVRLPTFEGKAVPVSFPINIQTTRPAPPAGAAPTAAAAPVAPPAPEPVPGGAAPPSVFVQP